AIGPSDVSIHQDGSARGVIGLFADPAESDALAPAIQFGCLGTTDNRAEVLQEVDIAAFEGQSNPDGGDVESNPYGVLAADNGGTFVVDASANALLYVDSEGSISVTAVFESRMTEVPEELQEPGMPSEIEM